MSDPPSAAALRAARVGGGHGSFCDANPPAKTHRTPPPVLRLLSTTDG